MAIKLSDKYEIDADENCYLVIEKKVAKSGKKAGEINKVTIGYVHDITHALELIYKRETRKWVSENDATLSMAAKAFGDISKDIKKFGSKFDSKFDV